MEAVENQDARAWYAQPRITEQALTIGQLIGSGGFGTVYHAKWGNRKVAIKKFSVSREEAYHTAEIQQEIALLERLKDRYVIQFYGTTYHEGQLVLIMDYAEGGSLHGAIVRGQLDWPAKLGVTQGIIRGLDYIHSQKILHRDLKSGNVLLTKHLEVKLCDFGLATVKVTSVSKNTGAKGTLRWMAPELFIGRPKYSTKSDIYALGMVMWEMAANCPYPFRDQGNEQVVISLVQSGEREVIPDETPAEYRAWIEKCWHREPDKRPEAHTMIKDDDEPIDDPLSPVIGGRPQTAVDVTDAILGLAISSPSTTSMRVHTLAPLPACRVPK
ncbi:hypothetical protein BGZ73_006811 [Actinomortierella ambigua]|nr:hypothetical protein BGZ73_006811 [Actinomortierella ambigua]